MCWFPKKQMPKSSPSWGALFKVQAGLVDIHQLLSLHRTPGDPDRSGLYLVWKKWHPPNPIGYHHLSHEISFSGVYQVYHYTVKLFCIISHLPKHPFNYHWRWVKRSINAHGLIVHDTLTANLIQRIHHVQHLIVLPCGDVNDMPWKKLTQADDTWEWNHSKI